MAHTSCDRDEVMANAKCYMCLNRDQRQMVKLHLLSGLVGIEATPPQLMESAKCFSCLNDKQVERSLLWLVCQIQQLV